MKKTPSELIYEFCKQEGICTYCKVHFVDPPNLRCEKCRLKHNALQNKSRASRRKVKNQEKLKVTDLTW